MKNAGVHTRRDAKNKGAPVMDAPFDILASIGCNVIPYMPFAVSHRHQAVRTGIRAVWRMDLRKSSRR